MDESTLFKEMELPDLQEYLKGLEVVELRVWLMELFMQYQHYRNLAEWNKAVRICEALAIIGWGETPGLEALHFKYFNGNPYTCFIDYRNRECIQSAIWSKRKLGFTQKPGRVFRIKDPLSQTEKIEEIGIDIQSGKFESQRNWIKNNPVKPRLMWGNAVPELQFIKAKIEALGDYLNTRLAGHDYGENLNFISILCFLSDETIQYEVVSQAPNSAPHYQSGRVKTLKYVPERLNKKLGVFTMRYHIPVDFGLQTEAMQLQQLKADVLEMVSLAAKTLAKNCPGYRFEQMEQDLKQALSVYLKNP